MIVTVTLNTALDVTYAVPAVRVHASHRVGRVTARAGGKGINTASVLHHLGHDVLAAGIAGGLTGDEVRADLIHRGIPQALTHCAEDSRRTVSIVDDEGDATIFNEPGPRVTASEWSRLLEELAATIDATGATVVTASGSLPGGVPRTAYAQIVRLAHDRGTHVLVDAEGEPLLHALEAGPDVVKPNRSELRQTTGLDDVPAAMEALRARGARAVVASLGADGARLHTADHRLIAHPGVTLSGNPTGAGDAMVAGLAAGLAEGTDLADALRTAVSWSAAAVLAPLAGDLDPDDAARILSTTTVEDAE